MSQRLLARALLASLMGLVLSATPGPGGSTAHAEGRPAVSVGEVNVSSGASAAGDAVSELSKVLRLALNAELSRLLTLTPAKRPLIVSATLTGLSSEQRDERAKASATLSLALRCADDQVLFAELRGRANVEEVSGNLASLRRAALQGAVRGALSRLPEVVERSINRTNHAGPGARYWMPSGTLATSGADPWLHSAPSPNSSWRSKLR